MPSYEIHGRNIWKWDFFLETVVYQGTTFSEKLRKSYPWRQDAFETETLQTYSVYNFTSYHTCTPIVKAPVWQTRSLENSTNKLLWESISDFKRAWWTGASHTILKEKLLLEVKLTERKAALLKKTTRKKKTEILPFVTQYRPALSVYKKEALMKKWNLIQNQPLPCQNFKEPPKVLFLWGRKIMAKDMLVRTKTWEG